MKTIFFIAASFAFSFSLFSQSNEETTVNLLGANIIDNNSIETKNELNKSKLDINSLKFNIQNQTKKKKSIPLGIVLSALLPGAGEFYGESYVKAGIFFGVEVLAWGTYIIYTLKGDNKTDEFQKYADANWTMKRYARWLNEEFGASGINPDEEDPVILRQQINAFESDPQTGFSHTLPEPGSQQYYELIGKYQNFMGGWADAENSSGWIVTSSNYFTYRTAMFSKYSIDRGDANDLYKTAKIGPIVAILNHILSAADAAWTISTYNKKIKVETGFRMDSYTSPYTLKYEMHPTFNMKVSF